MDTGATGTLVTPDIFEVMRGQKTGEVTDISGISGKPLRAERGTVNILGLEHEVDICSVDNEGIILGIDILPRLNYKLTKDSLYLQGKRHPLVPCYFRGQV